MCQSNHSLFVLHSSNSIIFLLLYIDDILITWNNSSIIRDLIHSFHSQFNMRHLVELKDFLGIEFICTVDGYILS